jgi:hypothetical protein
VTTTLAVAMIYVSFKIALVVLRRHADDADAAVARSWARALVASLAALSVTLLAAPAAGAPLFWVYVGLAGALYQATRAHDPTFAVRVGWRDLVRVAILDGGIWALTCL